MLKGLTFSKRIIYNSVVSGRADAIFHCGEPAAHVSNRCKSGIRPANLCSDVVIAYQAMHEGKTAAQVKTQ